MLNIGRNCRSVIEVNSGSLCTMIPSDVGHLELCLRASFESVTYHQDVVLLVQFTIFNSIGWPHFWQVVIALVLNHPKPKLYRMQWMHIIHYEIPVLQNVFTKAGHRRFLWLSSSEMPSVAIFWGNVCQGDYWWKASCDWGPQASIQWSLY